MGYVRFKADWFSTVFVPLFLLGLWHYNWNLMGGAKLILGTVWLWCAYDEMILRPLYFSAMAFLAYFKGPLTMDYYINGAVTGLACALALWAHLAWLTGWGYNYDNHWVSCKCPRRR